MTMTTTIAALRVRRVMLIEELGRVEAAIKAAENAKPRRIATRRNLRNSSWLTTSPERASDGWVLVYATEAMDAVANEYDHEGWISPEDFAALMADGAIDGDLIAVVD